MGALLIRLYQVVHTAPECLRHLLDGQNARFGMTIFPATNVLYSAPQGSSQSCLSHACGLPGCFQFFTHQFFSLQCLIMYPIVITLSTIIAMSQIILNISQAPFNLAIDNGQNPDYYNQGREVSLPCPIRSAWRLNRLAHESG